MKTYIYDKHLKKVVETDNTYKPYEGLTVIGDESEFVSRDAFPETVKWTGRRSKKRLMKKYGCVDYRDIKGVQKEKEKRIARLRESYKKDPMIGNIDIIKEKTLNGRRATRRKYFYTGR